MDRFLLIAALFLSAPLAAQAPWGWSLHGSLDSQENEMYLGRVLAPVGDLDQDGVADLIVGTDAARVNGMGHAGSVLVYSAKHGSLLWRADGSAAYDEFGSAVLGFADTDGDGIPDIAIGASGVGPGSGLIEMRSGINGALLWSIAPSAVAGLGYSLLQVPDRDGDLVPELLVGAIFAHTQAGSGSGEVQLYSGANGLLLQTLAAPAGVNDYGRQLADAGDLDGDGVRDLLVQGETASATVIDAYSGADMHLLLHVDVPSLLFLGVGSLASAGDLNADGVPDFLLGNPAEIIGNQAFAGRVFLYSGHDGSLLQTFDGQLANEQFGWSLLTGKDLDHDGILDFLVGAPFAAPGSVSAFSGSSGQLLFRLQGPPSARYFGQAMCALDNRDQDPLPEIAISAPGTFTPALFAGRIFLADHRP